MGQLSTKLGSDDVHASFSDRVSQHGRKPSDTSELKVSTLTGNEYDLLLFAFTDEIEEGVDDINVADQVCFDLCAVNFCCYRSGAS